jgi:hypothetical protein
MFLVITYPKLSKEDFNFIQEYRKINDPLYYDVVDPHFTIVFPVDGLTREEFSKEIKELLKNEKGFNFNLKSAVVNQDFSKEYFHEFLVPDEGFSGFIKLHDKLYSNNLKKHLRFDIDFIPHVGIGNHKEFNVCKKRVDILNDKDLSIKGSVGSVDIVEYIDNKVVILERIELA